MNSQNIQKESFEYKASETKAIDKQNKVIVHQRGK